MLNGRTVKRIHEGFNSGQHHRLKDLESRLFSSPRFPADVQRNLTVRKLTARLSLLTAKMDERLSVAVGRQSATVNGYRSGRWLLIGLKD